MYKIELESSRISGVIEEYKSITNQATKLLDKIENILFEELSKRKSKKQYIQMVKFEKPVDIVNPYSSGTIMVDGLGLDPDGRFGEEGRIYCFDANGYAGDAIPFYDLLIDDARELMDEAIILLDEEDEDAEENSL